MIFDCSLVIGPGGFGFIEEVKEAEEFCLVVESYTDVPFSFSFMPGEALVF